MDENKRGSFGSTIGFLLSAIGSAVGLGNIWGFPYKMGRCGGFTFLIVYLALAAFVGFAIMLSELAIGRSTGFGPVNAYKKISKKFKWIGWLAIISPFLIMTFYSVLGGYCIYYMVINVVGMFSGMPDSSSFAALLTNPWASIGCMVLFMVICYLINRGGVGGGIEKFNTIGMPALFVMLVIVIIRAWTLPNADVGLKYMFVPGYALKAGFFDKAPGFMEVLATAGGQMFFSLSLAMGAMITYGSYLGKNENLPKNSVIIVISDTLVAIMAGLAVIPAAVANGIAKGMAVSEIKLGGPNLLFATLQDVFHDMGTIGGIFGLIFYALVLIAAISSAISLIEAVSVTFIDHASAKGHERDRNKVLAVVCLAITLLACLVAVDGLGSNGIAPKDLFHINSKADWCADWLDFMDMISEGIAMPLGAMLMSIMVGWEPITSGMGNTPKAWFTVALAVTILMLLFQLFTLFGVRERKDMFRREEEKTTLRGMWEVLTKNDQLLWTTLAMSLFNIGYMSTTTMAIYYMQYVYGNKDMYAVLAAVVGVAQLLALVIFQSFSKRMPREKLYLLATILVMIGYAIFFFAEVSIILIAVGALFIFIGQAFIQLLMLMFLEDTIEYGQWKNGKRSESITLSVQPLINKIGGAVSMGITSLMLVWSGIKVGETAAESISASGQFTVKLMMIVLPVVFILAGYIIYRCKFKINKEMYDRIISDLRVRGELHAEPADVVEVTETVEVKITKE